MIRKALSFSPETANLFSGELAALAKGWQVSPATGGNHHIVAFGRWSDNTLNRGFLPAMF
jgi:hypothetical protein